MWLKSILKKQGEVIWGFANGIDFSPILDQPPANKGYGNSTTTPYDSTLFDEIDYDKLEKLDQTVDSLRKRFGMDSVMRAAFLKQPIDHMSGGISREKRTVDYDRITIE